MSDVNPSSNESSPEDTDKRETSDSLPDNDLHNDPAVLKLVDTFASDKDDPDLMVVNIGEDEVPPHKEDDEGEPEPVTDPTPAGDADTEEVKPTEEPKGETEEEPKEEAPAEEEKPAAKVDATKPDEDDDSYPSDEELAGYTENSQKRIRQLIASRKRTEEDLEEFKADADYKRQLDATLEQLGAKPESWDQWVQLGFALQQGAEGVPAILREMADNLDGKTSSPAAPEPPTVPDKLDADLQAQVDSLQMSEDLAKQWQAERAKAAAPAPAPTPRSTTQQEPPARVGPSLSNSDEEYGKRAIDAVNEEYSKKYPSEWQKLVPEIHAEMQKYAGTSPRQWGRIARDAAEKVIRRHKGNVAPDPDPVVRTTGNGGKKKPSAMDSKEAFVDNMLAGKFFSK